MIAFLHDILKKVERCSDNVKRNNVPFVECIIRNNVPFIKLLFWGMKR
jgi:hypothetical protein